MSDLLRKLAQLPLRPELHGVEPYGAPQIDVDVALNVNENSFDIPTSVLRTLKKAVSAELAGLNRYPDRDHLALREALAGYLNASETTELSAQNLWAANGSNEILQQLLQAFGGSGRTLLSFEPSYSMYPLLARGTSTDFIGGYRSSDYELTAASVRDQISQYSPNITIICSPNNPTGTYVDNSVIQAAYQAVEKVNGILIVDEAYAEFRDPELDSAVQLLPGRPRLIVSRTMSKAFAFAGVRLGYVAAAEEVIASMQLVRLPYHLSSITQALALGALEHADLMLATVTTLREQRQRIADELQTMGYRVLPSESNFVYFTGVSEPQVVFDALLGRSILIRLMAQPHTLRVSSGTPAETSVFLKAMREITKEYPPLASAVH